MKKSYLLFILFFLFIYGNSISQIGIGTSNPDTSSFIDLSSTTKGFLIPRMQTFQRNLIINPIRGLFIYNTTNNILEVYSGPIEAPSWVGVTGAKGGVGYTGAVGPARTYLTIDITMLSSANGVNSSVDGGNNNIANGAQAAVLGGNLNIAGGVNSAVVGGYNNKAIGASSIIIGGHTNQSDGIGACVIGGNNNFATGINSAVVGGNHNLSEVSRTAVVGGNHNKATFEDAVVSGGINNVASGSKSAVLGGENNTSSGSNSSVVGGFLNISSGTNSCVIGGNNNTSEGTNSVVLAGNFNKAVGVDSLVASGSNNTATGDESTVSSGVNNNASSYGEWVGGLFSTNYLPLSVTGFEGTDRVFNIGNGSSALSRSDAFTITKNGLAILPSVTNALITESSIKAIVTKEYINEKVLQFKTLAPASANDVGIVGQIRMTTNFIYICIATNTWVRKANSSTTW
jgi:hypothetical protein